MNRFAALDIDEFEPDQDERDEALFQEEQLLLGTQYVVSHGPPHVWRRKDGLTMPVSDMSDTHLLNSARYMLRKLEEDVMQNQLRFSLRVLKDEANRRGRLL